MADANIKKPGGTGGLRVGDLVCVVVGYALAAVLMRSFQEERHGMTVLQVVGLVVAFVWAGIAMSGPLVLLIERRPPLPPSDLATTDPSSRFAKEEWAWMGIGYYLIVLTLLIVAMPINEASGTVLITLLVVIPPIAMIFLGCLPSGFRQSANSTPPQSRWTKTAAVWVARSWPIVWGLVIFSLFSY